MKRAREESPDDIQDQSKPENDEVKVRILWFESTHQRPDFSFSQAVVIHLLEMFPDLPRKHLEKEVAKSRSNGERTEDLIRRLVVIDHDQVMISLMIDLTHEGEESQAELVESRGKAKYYQILLLNLI